MNFLKYLNYEEWCHKVYYYVPQCPCCDSYMTGRFVKAKFNNDKEWIIKEALKIGELVSIVEEKPEYATAFCYNCNYEWKAKIKCMWLPINKIKEQKDIRNIKVVYDVLFDNKSSKQRDKTNFFVYHMSRFIGRL